MVIQTKIHETVLLNEVVQVLVAYLKYQGRFIDATLGTGGHTLELLKHGSVLGIDQDPEMIEIARKRVTESNEFKFVCGNFKDLRKIALNSNFDQVDGVVFDLGVSNLHFASLTRGFSFVNKKAALDMRISNRGLTAADLLNSLRRDHLVDLFQQVMGKKQAVIVVEKVLAKRKIDPIRTVGDFLETCGVLQAKKNLNPATLAFLALRIAVNSEIDNLRESLPQALSLLKKGGRLGVISFHSLEDRIVKSFFREMEATHLAKVLYKKVLTASAEETYENPKARSAHLRFLEKI